jgi:CheY-like chemotaxis protein
MGNDHLDAQVAARLLRRAANIAGGAGRLAELLGVRPEELARWLAGRAFPPEPIFERALAILLDAHAALGPPLPAGQRRPRVLVAASEESAEAICRMLGGKFEPRFDLVRAHTVTEALDLVQGAAVVKSAALDAIVCGQHFEGSQMMHFLECVKGYRPSSAIPFICCRAQPTQLGGPSLAAMREACEALGAVAYIDIPEQARRKGAEAAAVEFRDAVAAAVGRPRGAIGLRVLVVDDNPDAAHMLTALLRIAGHDVIKAANGAQALREAATQPLDVAVIDLAMPGMSGYELAASLRGQAWAQGMTLIALTGRGAPEDAARARAAGFDHHFLKPVTLERLLAVFPAPNTR